MGHRMSRENALLFLLSSAAGSIDALSFIGYGVFTSAMSGNTVLLGIAVARLHLGPAVYSAVALAGYVLGAFVGTVFGDAGRQLRWLLLAEVVLLAGFAALGFVYPTRAECCGRRDHRLRRNGHGDPGGCGPVGRCAGDSDGRIHQHAHSDRRGDWPPTGE